MGVVNEAGSLLHVGSGGDPLPAWLQQHKETRLDIDASTSPDIVADMVNIGDIGPYDVVFCQHALEHLHPFDVRTALEGFRRVLQDGGCVIVFVPDLEGVAPTDDVLFESPAGPITGLDLFYGFNRLTQDKPHMAHKTAFVQDTLKRALDGAGFKSTRVDRMFCYNMMGIGIK